MASNVTTRETLRDRVVSLLTTALTGVGNPVQTVFNHEPSESELSGQTPVVWVKSGPIFRVAIAEHNTRKKTTVRLFIHSAVSLDENDGLTPAQVEDKIDAIEKEIADVRFDNQIDAGYWEWWTQIGPSIIGYTIIGKEYRTEVFEMEFSKRDD